MDTISQLDSYQVMRHYDGFLEQGRVRGGRSARATGKAK
jgi:hypothetical protein